MSHFNWPINQFFWNIGNALNRSTSFDLVDLTFLVSTHGVKLWEHIGKKKKNKIKSLSAHPLKKNKKLGLLMSALAA
jgi:hypothetical protein